MKLTTLLMTIALLTASAAGYSQITLRERNVPLEKVLSDIEKQTKYVFLYDAGDLKAAPITVEVNNVTLDEALKQCLAGLNVEYTVEENNVLLRAKALSVTARVKAKEADVIDVKGTVTDEGGLPLPGATVRVKGGNNVTTTDPKGNFVLHGVDPKASLVISFIGYESQTVTAQEDLGTITLKQQHSALDEVKVIAYGTITERLNVGDVTTVRAADLERQPVANPILAVEGRVPGMFVQQSTGMPGAQTQVQIRGRNSISNGLLPLYIVDGVPYNNTTLFGGSNAYVYGNSSGDPLSFLDIHDIESISVLKDADATAIYGSRGANGVIIITTKKGHIGKRQFDVNLQDGFSQVPREMPLLNTQQYLQIRNEAFANDKLTPNATADYDLTLWDTSRYTDWQKVLIGGTARYQDMEGTLSGGDSTTQYLAGIGVNRQTSVFPGNYSDRKGSFHIRLDNTSPNKKLMINLSVSFLLDNNNLPSEDLTNAALTLPPNAPPLYSSGSINWAPNAQGVSSWPDRENPVAYTLDRFVIKTSNLITSAVISYDLFPGLKIKADFGYNNMRNDGFSDVPFSALDPSLWITTQRRSQFTTNNSQNWNIEPQILYNRKFGNHKFSILIGNTTQQNSLVGQIVNAAGFGNDQELENIAAATSITTPSIPVNSVYRYSSLFGRFNYSFLDKYLFDFNFRRDGSSSFGPANRFANFYSVGGAWIFSEESFVKGKLPFLSFGKIRTSYGSTGNDQIGSYRYLDQYANITGVGVPYQGATGLYPTSVYSPNLQWEVTKKLEGGLEIGILKDRILLNANYYINKSSNQLIPYAIASIAGFTSELRNVPALVENRGVELELTTINLSARNFRWSSSFNYTTSANKLFSAKGLSPALEQFIGYKLNSVFVYKYLDVNPITGVYEFADSHGVPTSTPNPSTDMKANINLDPQFYGGLQNTITYKKFSIDFFFQFVKQQGQQYLYFLPPGTFSQQPETILNRWQAPGDVTNIPRLSTTVASAQQFVNFEQSSLAYGDASYIRLQNASLSWQLPDILIKRIGFKDCRLVFLGQNLWTITGYKGLDPETRSINSLPVLRTITAGIKATL
ncbi:MAG: SusC/RagA family TonB-linked outer membrane protein [Mucilaginibacter sp.]